MDLTQFGTFLGKFSELVQDHSRKALVAVALTVTSGWWGIFWAWRKWRTRQDMDCLTVRLNIQLS